MKLTIQDVYNLSEGLTELADKDLPIKSALTVQRNHTKVLEEVKSADELRKKLIEKYKESDNEDGTVQIGKDSVQDFNKEFAELMAEEIEMDLGVIDVETFGDISVKPRTLSLITPIITDEDVD